MAGKIRSAVFTINNPTHTKEEVLKLLQENGGKKGIIGDEVGENNVKHLQGYIMFKNSRAFNAIKKLIPRAHIEKANGTEAQNYEYCSKENNYVSFGEFRMPATRKDVRKRILLECVENKSKKYMLESEYINRPKCYEELASKIREYQYKKEMYDKYEEITLKEYQCDIMDELFNQTEREVLWIVDVIGGRGKSFLCRYLHYRYGWDLYDGVTSARDIAPMLSERPEGVIFDVTRSDASKFSYQTLEQVKNGYVCSGKYGGYIRRFNPPKVLVCANFAPDRSQLSEDRWSVLNLEDANEEKVLERTEEIKAIWPKTYIPEDPTKEDE